MLERDLETQVVDLARLGGWMRYHTHDSRKSAAGFPDEVLVHPGRGLIVFAELKASDGRLRPEQGEWLRALDAVAQHTNGRMHVDLWRPRDLPEIERILLQTRSNPTGGTSGVRSRVQP